MPATSTRIVCFLLTLSLFILHKSSAKALSELYETKSIRASSESNHLLPLYLIRHMRRPYQNDNKEIMKTRNYNKRSFMDYGDDLGWESDLFDQFVGQDIDAKRSPFSGFREPRLRFRLESDGNLRIGRGFGKRSTNDGQKEEYKTPWTSPTIHEFSAAEEILKEALEKIRDDSNQA